MPVFHTQIDALIAADRLHDAVTCLLRAIPARAASLRDEALALQAELTRRDRQRRRGEVSSDDDSVARTRLAFRVLEINRAAPEECVDATVAPAATVSPAPVFISYCHVDAEPAQALCAALDASGLPVLIDREAMRAGQSIPDFVRGAIRASRATVCVVSEASLLSGWVAQETMLALLAEGLWERRRFIACYIDERFLEIGFRLAATKLIDMRLDALQALRAEHAARRIDSDDLDAEHSRLFVLRHELGRVLHRLRNSLCLDLRPLQREATLARLVEALHAPAASEAGA